MEGSEILPKQHDIEYGVDGMMAGSGKWHVCIAWSGGSSLKGTAGFAGISSQEG